MLKNTDRKSPFTADLKLDTFNVFQKRFKAWNW